MHLKSIRGQLTLSPEMKGSTSKNGIADSYVIQLQPPEKFNAGSNDTHVLSNMILRNVAIRHSKSVS